MRSILADHGRQTPTRMVYLHGFTHKTQAWFKPFSTVIYPKGTRMVPQSGSNHLFEVVFRGGLYGWFKPEYTLIRFTPF